MTATNCGSAHETLIGTRYEMGLNLRCRIKSYSDNNQQGSSTEIKRKIELTNQQGRQDTNS